MIAPNELKLPTELHEHAAESVLTFFNSTVADTILVTRSCAFGTAVAQSDLDLVVLVESGTSTSDAAALEQAWLVFRSQDEAILELCAFSQFSALHLDFQHDVFNPPVWDDNGGPDGFEVLIGNVLAYSVPISEEGPTLKRLKAEWLPYYDDQLRASRLDMARRACVADLDCVPFYLDREQHFQAFDRLYKAFQEYLQALFICHRTYPIGYDRWIKPQVCDRLGLPDVYAMLPPLLEITDLESRAMMTNVDKLRSMVTSLPD